MSKSIRDKENELRQKWGYLKELSKGDDLKRKKSFELYEAEDETYKKWKFFKGYLDTKNKVDKYEETFKK